MTETTDRPAPRLSERARGHLAMLAFSLAVAGSFPFGAMVGPHIEPVAFNALRLTIAAVLLTGWVARTRGLRRADFRAPWRHIVLAGFFAFYFVMMFEGLKYAEPVSIATVFTAMPLMTAVFGWLILGQRTTPRMALALTIGAVGAMWVIFRADLSALLRFQVGKGEAIYLIGCVSHAIYIPLLRRLNRGESAAAFNVGILWGCAGLLTLFGLPTILATDWAGLPGIVWIALAYTSVASSALSFTLVLYGSMRLPAAKVMAYTYLTPSFVLLWEIALGRPLPPPAILGGVAITIVALLILLKDDHDR